ncbi:GNAT family N-acetyltransferase [Eubacterium oxidoreducens]|nr:GNAT family N-acetyltransferase [Eubacterium oxidoreducens]
MDKRLRLLIDFLVLAAGAVIAAFAIEEFLVPCTILDGGVIGVGIIISTVSKIPLGLLTIVLNIPFLIIGWKKMGYLFVIKAAYSMVIFSIALEAFEPLKGMTDEYLLAVCFGGVILGFGVGLVIRYGGCLDGTETVAILLNRAKDFPVGRTVLIFNLIIYSVAGILFGPDRAMYSLLTYFITSKILDLVEGGIGQAKSALIITDAPTEVAENIYKYLGRTVTIIRGEGLVSGSKTILYCVLTQFEVPQLKSVIDSVDASTFVTVSEVSEIVGNHVKSRSKEKQVMKRVEQFGNHEVKEDKQEKEQYVIESTRIYWRDESGKLMAEVTFPEMPNHVYCINHTYVDESLRGQGIAGKLIQMAADTIKENGGTVTATCSYASKWLEKNEV